MGRPRDHSEAFVVDESSTKKRRQNEQDEAEGLETDPQRLAQRQKQIDYGKNTLGYQAYIEQVPREERKHWKEVGSAELADPITPDATKKCSKRMWEGRVKAWRRALHKYDPTMTRNTATELSLPLAAAPTASKAGNSGTDPRHAGLSSCAAQESDDDVAAPPTSQKRPITAAACGKENEGASERSDCAISQPTTLEQGSSGPAHLTALDSSIDHMVKHTVTDVFGEWEEDDEA